MTSTPFLTILTPCLNRAQLIAGALESVTAQGLPGVEHIVLDGGSSDGTLDVLARYPRLTVHSGPDRGLYDALNQGFALARGEWIGLLNSDDRYLPGAFSALTGAVQDRPGVMAWMGGAESAPAAGAAHLTAREYPPLEEDELWRQINWRGPAINAWFFHRSVFERFGGFDPRFRISADLEFVYRCLLLGLEYQTLPITTYRYLQHDDSLTFSKDPAKRLRSLAEDLAVCERLFQVAGKSPRRRELRRWHSSLAVHSVQGYAAKRQYIQAAAGLWRYLRGWTHDPEWPWALLRIGRLRTAKHILRGQ